MYLDKQTINEEGEEIVEIPRPWMETPIDWKKVKSHCNNFIYIFSDNDPYVPLSTVDLFKKKLGTEVIILRNKGHFTEDNGIKNCLKSCSL